MVWECMQACVCVCVYGCIFLGRESIDFIRVSKEVPELILMGRATEDSERGWDVTKRITERE